jgi:hypothetical protein
VNWRNSRTIAACEPGVIEDPAFEHGVDIGVVEEHLGQEVRPGGVAEVDDLHRSGEVIAGEVVADHGRSRRRVEVDVVRLHHAAIDLRGQEPADEHELHSHRFVDALLVADRRSTACGSELERSRVAHDPRLEVARVGVNGDAPRRGTRRAAVRRHGILDTAARGGDRQGDDEAEFR